MILNNLVEKTESDILSSEGYNLKIVKEKYSNGKLVYFITNNTPIQTITRQVSIARNLYYDTVFVAGTINYVQHSLMVWGGEIDVGDVDAYSVVSGPSHNKLAFIGVDTTINTTKTMNVCVHVRIEGVWK